MNDIILIHGDAPCTLPGVLAKRITGWVDTTWRDDACASVAFSLDGSPPDCEGTYLHIWVDTDDRSLSENIMPGRLSLAWRNDTDGSWEDLVSSDDPEDLISKIDELVLAALFEGETVCVRCSGREFTILADKISGEVVATVADGEVTLGAASDLDIEWSSSATVTCTTCAHQGTPSDFGLHDYDPKGLIVINYNYDYNEWMESYADVKGAREGLAAAFSDSYGEGLDPRDPSLMDKIKVAYESGWKGLNIVVMTPDGCISDAEPLLRARDAALSAQREA